ncbi:MAG: hypothetical protein K2X03_14320 [Bryobacteraceae bacterium]|nr:hypothetical protein [Bryobacteraceae bacterium]
MRSRKTRLTEALQGVALVDRAVADGLRDSLAPISEAYLRKLLRASGVPLAPEVEGVRQEDFASLERTLLATRDPAAVREARRHAALARRSPKADWAVKTEMMEWMRVWLETPAAFPVWLRLRKATPEFRALEKKATPPHTEHPGTDR